MRTKTLLATAAIVAAGLASSLAQQNVYSLNVVGYVNVPVENGKLSLLANPLKPQNADYDINNIVKLQDPGSDASVIYGWDVTGQQWTIAGYIDGFGWDTPANANVGDGFFILPTLTQTITFVGEVQTGTTLNPIGTALTLQGNVSPIAGPVPGSTVGHDGDSIFTWDFVGQQWGLSGFIDGFGWDSASIEGPAIGVAEGFFYQNTGAALSWSTTLNP